MISHVSDFGSNVNENLENWGKQLGRSKRRRRIFDLIYSSQKKRWTAREIMSETGLGDVTTSREAKKLSDSGLLHVAREGGRLVYEKDPRVQHSKRTIIKLADSTKARVALPTKRRPSGSHSTVVRIREDRGRARFITIDDVDSFDRVRGVRADTILGDAMSETAFRDGVKSILGELGHFADWGGEQNDLFSTEVRIKGKRQAAAFAFKGPGTKGALTPGKCGKNGDQIQRLLESPATAFFFQYNRQISQSVVAQMRTHALFHSAHTREEVYYGIVNGHDSQRLVIAYPDAFAPVRNSKVHTALRARRR